MQNFVGYPLEDVEKHLKEKNLNYKIEKNNFKVEGDRLLVTNAKSQDEMIVLTVGEFIFEIGDNKNGN